MTSSISFMLTPCFDESRVHDVPLPALLGERLPTIGTEAVITTLPACLAALLVRLDQALLFEPMEHRVEHAFGPLELATREAPDLLDDRVAVARPLLQDREQER